MKKLLVTLLSVASFGAALPAFAGPDWQIIEQGRKAKHARMQQEAVNRTRPDVERADGYGAEQDAKRREWMKQCKEMMREKR